MEENKIPMIPKHQHQAEMMHMSRAVKIIAMVSISAFVSMVIMAYVFVTGYTSRTKDILQTINLEWTTQKANVLYSMDSNRYPTRQKHIIIIGEKDGTEYVFNSSHDAAKTIGCDHKSILRSCKTGN